ncbi:hypothetical protein ACHAQH_006122 [Verticillium albo-atrum]
MAEVFSVVASVTGVLAFAATTARALVTIVQDISDAPEEVLNIGRDVQSLAAVLATAHDTCARHDIGTEDKDLANALGEYVGMCQEAMQALRALLEPMVNGGGGGGSSGRRSPIRFVQALGWTMRKGEVKTLRGRLNEGKASLTLTLSALNGVLEGKGQEDIRADISKVYGQMMSEFRNLEAGRKVKMRVEDDLISNSASRGRRPSASDITDVSFAMRRFLEPEGVSHNAVTPALDSSSNPDATMLSPWSQDPHAILEAVRSQNRHLIDTLLSHGVSLSPRSEQGYSVLHYCAIIDDAETATLLLEHGAIVNAKDYNLSTPFRLALDSESLKVAQVLTERECIIDDLSEALFRLLVRKEEPPGIQGLLAALALRLNETPQGPYLIHEAIIKKNRGALRLLLGAGFKVTKKDQNGVSPFHLALRSCDQPVMKLLLEHGADIYERLPRSVLETVGVPSSWHTSTLDPGRNDHVPLVIASRYMRDDKMIRFLLKNGADPNRPLGNTNVSVLNGLCAGEYISQAKTLLQGGADPNLVPKSGQGPMYWAARCQNNELMACLLAHGGDFNLQLKHDGSTPLSIAAYYGNTRMVKMLLDAGANPSRKNHGGKTALDVARARRKGEVISILEEVLGEGNGETSPVPT